MNELKHDNVTVKIKKFTPQDAASILDNNNINNRAISKARIAEYSSAMSRGEWLFNGDSIRISDDGVLLDGQHRLTALLKSNTEQYFIVIENMKKNIGFTIDGGKNRTGGDSLTMQSGTPKHLAAAISGAIKLFQRHEKGLTMMTGGYEKLTNTQVVNKYIEQKPLIEKCCAWLNENVSRKGGILSKSEMLAITMILSSADEADAFLFCNMVFCGIGINEICAQSHLRDYLLECKSKAKKSNQQQRLHSIIKVWNSVRSGRNMKSKGSVVFRSGYDVFKKAI